MAFGAATTGSDPHDRGMPVYGRLARAALMSRRHAESVAVLEAASVGAGKASGYRRADAVVGVQGGNDADSGDAEARSGGVGGGRLADSMHAVARGPSSSPVGDAVVNIPVAPGSSRERELEQHTQELERLQRRLERPRDQGGRVARSKVSKGAADKSKSRGPAFDHLVQQSATLMKRLKDAHGHLCKAFDATPGAGHSAHRQTAMTATLLKKTGQLALKCVTEALPVAESLVDNWDNAWGSQMHHLTARVETQDNELERARDETEAALAEAEAYRIEAEAHREEMDANVDRIERAAAALVERDKEVERGRALEERLDAEVRERSRVTAAAVAAEERVAALASERDRLAADLAESRAACDAAERAAHLARGELSECRGELREAAKLAAETTAARKAAEEARVALEAARAENAPLKESLERERAARGAAERLAADAAEARRTAEDRASTAEAAAQRCLSQRARLEAEARAEAENARNNRGECKSVKEQAAAKQMELQEKIIALEEELRETRKGLAQAQEAVVGAGKLPNEMKKLRESSWRLRQDLAAAERVRFAAKIVAGNAEAELAECAMEGNADAMDELAARNASNKANEVVSELAEQMAAMRSEMSAMRNQTAQGLASVKEAAIAKAGVGERHHNDDGREVRKTTSTSARSSSSSDDSPPLVPRRAVVTPPPEPSVVAEMETLRARLAEANAHVAVLAESRDRALMESVRFAATSAAFVPYPTPLQSGLGRMPSTVSVPGHSSIAGVPNGPRNVIPGTSSGYLTPEVSRYDVGGVSFGGGAPSTSIMPPALSPSSAPYMSQGLMAARAEADRLMRDAEAKGREATARLTLACAALDVKGKKGSGLGRSPVRSSTSPLKNPGSAWGRPRAVR